ncbi:SGNH hydrolase [Pseudovirgaria hyperparasitica]|uniref:SGNH hydrolase n=1 Tax=Pseudovirgaria hyperparasitica TaxID=470096 RepID=A0A6A6WED4_9PEZI|nr:SGNH hydrolase [Pseudovirgaria hyperparasitica]KAF2760519.1 SGNH hydrolase [Pseudovirgaria hyperparasitica]
MQFLAIGWAAIIAIVVTSVRHWVDIWTSMPQLTEPGNLPPTPFNGSRTVFSNSTIRQTLRMTLSADQIRIRVTNVFGLTDLLVTAMTVALPANGSAGVAAVQPQTVMPLTFSGSQSIVIPNGALAVSDPIDFLVHSGSMISVSMYLSDGQQGFAITSHPGSRTTSWLTSGNTINDANMTSTGLASVAHWYYLSAVEAWLPNTSRAFAIVGDSITDGRGSETDKNNRWPDLLLARMQKQPSTSPIAVLNQAAGGNRVLADGLGPNAQGRIDRDVLSHSGVRYAMLFEGVNDIGSAAATTAAQNAVYSRLLLAYQQLATRIHAFSIPLFAATITPFSAPNSTIQPYSDPLREATRSKVNEWIRTSGVFDRVVDFDAVLRDPRNSTMLDPQYDSGDYLHPNVRGYQALADAFPLELFDRFSEGVSSFI